MNTLKRTRNRYKERLGVGLGISFGIGGVILVGMILVGGPVGLIIGFMPGFFFATIGLIITFFATAKDRQAYHEEYKRYFVRASLEKAFPGCLYSHNAGLSRGAIAATGMMNLGDSFSSNDYVSGTFKNLNFAQADVHITETHTDSDGNRTTVTIFKGRYAIFEFKKKFNFRLEVVGKRFGAYQVPHGSSFKKFQKISTESAEFNKRFRVLAEDGFEAFYILDPAFIERVQKLGEEHKYSVALFFVNNALHIAINDNSDSFEAPSPFKEIDEKAEFAKVENDIKLITNVVDSLRLEKES